MTSLRATIVSFFATCVGMPIAFAEMSTSSDELAAQAQLDVALRSRYPMAERIQIEPLIKRAPADDRRQTCGEPTFSVTRLGPRSAVRTTFNCDDGARTVIAWFDVKIFQNVAIAARDVPPLTKLVSADGLIAERDISSSECSILTATSELDGRRSRRAVRSGTVLCKEHLEAQPAVARGDAVTVRYVAERVQLTTKGIARHDAEVGQRLALLNPTTKEIFSGVVIENGEVQIHAR